MMAASAMADVDVFQFKWHEMRKNKNDWSVNTKQNITGFNIVRQQQQPASKQSVNKNAEE